MANCSLRFSSSSTSSSSTLSLPESRRPSIANLVKDLESEIQKLEDKWVKTYKEIHVVTGEMKELENSPDNKEKVDRLKEMENMLRKRLTQLGDDKRRMKNAQDQLRCSKLL